MFTDPPPVTTTDVGSFPAVCTEPAGRSLSSTSTDAVPAGMPDRDHVPPEPVTVECTPPNASVTVTSTPDSPGSPESCTPLPFTSWNTVPVTLPCCW